jgi:hypothetical protein
VRDTALGASAKEALRGQALAKRKDLGATPLIAARIAANAW